jgi:Fur family ferric uptake transcriptional regulator
MAHPHPTHAAHAPLDSLSFDGLVAALKKEGLRMTANRHSILKALLAAAGPLSLEEIQTEAARLGSRPDFATVFRTMSVLEQLRLAQKVNLGRSTSHYELIDPERHHDHLVCVDCGKVTLIEDRCPVEKLERQLAKDYGFTGLTHSLEFFGHCQECTTLK